MAAIRVTCSSLAAALTDTSPAPAPVAESAPAPAKMAPVSTSQYLLCGALQFLSAFGYSYLLALDKETGKVRWRVERPEVTRGYATPGVYRPKNGPAELIVPGAYQLIAYNLATGEKLWWVRGLAWQLKSVPLIDGDIAYVSGWEIGGDTDTAAAGGSAMGWGIL